MDTITAGSLSALILEIIKYLFRRFVVFDMDYDFPPSFYIISLPVLNVLVVPLLALLDVGGYEIPSDWNAWILLVIKTLLGSMISVFTYENGIYPLKSYLRITKQ